MKKGFTLVELLAVLVILGVITLVAVPNVIKTNQQSAEQNYEEFKKTIENAAEVYMETHIDKKPKNNADTVTVTVSDLKEYGFINRNLINPKTANEVNDNDYVKVEKDNGTLKYTYIES